MSVPTKGSPRRLRRPGSKFPAQEPLRLDPLKLALKALHSATAPSAMTPEELEKQRRSQEALGRLTAPMTGMCWQEFLLGRMPAAWMRLERPHQHRRAILYCHGGGYTSGNLGYSRVLASKLTNSTGYDLLTFEYRLAPEHPYPAALQDALAAWDHLMYLGYGARDVVVAGDSAGGNLALVLCQQLKATGRMLPAALLLFSPWTDMSTPLERYAPRAKADPILTPEYIAAVRQAYAGTRDLREPSLSPLYGDLSGFPPTLVQVGTHELLYEDAVRLRDAMVQAGSHCMLEVWEDMWHVFQMFPLKKSQSAMRSIARFLLETL